jgi:hypothetical protein
MTIHSAERAVGALPAQTVPAQQAAPEQPEAPEQPVDHHRRHSSACYWDLRECRWSCGP